LLKRLRNREQAEGLLEETLITEIAHAEEKDPDIL
jgi:hypothetical protein